MDKRERHALIREIIESHAVASQEELRHLLARRGWDVTQSTLSRDLRELRVSRAATANGAQYTLPTSGDEARPTLARLLPGLFTHVDGVGELLILHTLPGGAQPIGLALDGERWPEVLGTIAGDDTVLVICRTAASREQIVRRLSALARGRSNSR